MAGPQPNSSPAIIDEFEESFQQCVHAITKAEASTGTEKDEIAMDVDLTTTKFIDLARQMEAFFIQKRFVLSVRKPQLVLKEENTDLRVEIARKDEIIKKHYDRIEMYKTMLSDSPSAIPAQAQPPSSQPAPALLPPQQLQQQGPPTAPIPNQMAINPNMMPGPQMPMQMSVNVPRMPMQAQLQAQHMQQQQQPQQQQMQQMQHQNAMAHQIHMQQMQVEPSQMYMQQGMNPSRNVAMPMSNFPQGPNVLPGPLAFLEKTTSNIG